MGYTRGNDGPITLIPISHSSEHNVRMTGYWYSRVLLRKAHRTSFQVQGVSQKLGFGPFGVARATGRRETSIWPSHWRLLPMCKAVMTLRVGRGEPTRSIKVVRHHRR
jgi:hypothetical protein